MLHVHVHFVMRRRESGTWWVSEGQVQGEPITVLEVHLQVAVAPCLPLTQSQPQARRGNLGPFGTMSGEDAHVHRATLLLMHSHR